MDARTFACLLGGEAIAGNRVVAPGPGHSTHDRSLSVLLEPGAPDGFLVNSFAGDDWRDCREHVLRLLGKPSGMPVAAPRPHDGGGDREAAGRAPADRIALAARLWAEAFPFAGSPAETYLTTRIVGLATVDFDRSVFRSHPACPFRLADGTLARLPAMLAVMVDISTNDFRGVHRTALQADGSGKADHPGLAGPKRMLGCAAGACVKLSADENVTTGLHLAEGIETALACLAFGFSPLWAALSAGAINNFPVLAGVEALTIMADNDRSGAGLMAARSCAKRWTAAGAEVRIAWPPEVGRDWADHGGERP
jgi:putative DNA primase/helicase